MIESAFCRSEFASSGSVVSPESVRRRYAKKRWMSSPAVESMPLSGWLKCLAFKRSESTVMPAKSGHPGWGGVANKQNLDSRFRGKDGRRSRIPVDIIKIPRLIAEGCLILEPKSSRAMCLYGTQSAMKILNSRNSLAFLVEAKTSFLPSRENIGKLSKRAP